PCLVLLVDARTGAVAKRLSYAASLTITQDGMTSVAFSPDGRWLVAGTRSGKLHRWDLTKQEPEVLTGAGHKGAVSRLQFSPDGKSLYSLHSNRMLRRWDTTADSWSEAASTQLAGPTGQVVVSPHADWLIYQGAEQLRFLT